LVRIHSKTAVYLRANEALRSHDLDDIFQEQVLGDVKVQNCILACFPRGVLSLTAWHCGDLAEAVAHSPGPSAAYDHNESILRVSAAAPLSMKQGWVVVLT
jgi:hypothetical protein